MNKINLLEMSLLDIMAKWENTQDIIKSYDSQAKTCLCCNHLFETLEQVCNQFQISKSEITKKLNKCIKSSYS